MTKQLIKSTAIVGGMTMISRLMGFARDMLIANLFGVTPATDAFFVAFKIPNFLRRLFAEGAFAQAFVPALAAYQNKGDCQSLRLFIDKTAGNLLVRLLIATALGLLAAPLLITAFAPGFLWGEGQHELATQMLRITLPYLMLVTLVAFFGAILNTQGQFALPALAPVFLNLAMIATAIWLAPLLPEPIVALAWGVLIAGVVQLAFLSIPLRRLGLLPRPRLAIADSRIGRTINTIAPAIFGVSVLQINLLLDTLLASFLAPGSVSWLYYSDRVVEFPLGIFGVAVATVILPSLSRHHATDDPHTFSHSLSWGLRLVLAVGLPATIGLTLLAKPILFTLFQYNQFDADDVEMAARSLTTFSMGLLGFILLKVLLSAFSARQEIQIIMRSGIYAVLFNLILGALLAGPMAHAGIALATSLSAYFNAALLLHKLVKAKIFLADRSFWRFVIQIVLASSAMTAFLLVGIDDTPWQAWNVTQRSSHLLILLLTAIAIYGLALRAVGVRLKSLLVH